VLRTIYGDDQRYRDTYWSRFPGKYFAGDGAKVDEDGYWWILGRVDDVLNVAGIASAPWKWRARWSITPWWPRRRWWERPTSSRVRRSRFVTLKDGHPPTAAQGRSEGPRDKKIGRDRPPDDIFFTADLPKTRSGKIMRRLLKDIAEGRTLGDTTTLADPARDKLKEQYVFFDEITHPAHHQGLGRTRRE
jgi:acetyl-CoA synthetase